MRLARINAARQVIEVFSFDRAGAAGRLAPELVETLADVPDDAAPGNWLDGPPPPPLPTADDVRAEAQRRMMALVGARDAEHLAVIVSNGVREQGRLHALLTGIPGIMEPRAWTAAEATRAQMLWGADQAIEAIRAASNVMELDPPATIEALQTDSRWP